MKRGFVRAVRGLRAKKQEAKLSAAGVDPIYDDLAAAVASLRKGDQLCVWGGLHVMAPVRRGMRAIIDEVHALGCVVIDLSKAPPQSSAGQGIAMLDDAMTAVSQEQRFGDPSKAGKDGAAKRWANAEKPKRTPKRVARGPWKDRKLTIKQALAHDDMKGWNRSAAYRELGTRDILPARD